MKILALLNADGSIALWCILTIGYVAYQSERIQYIENKQRIIATAHVQRSLLYFILFSIYRARFSLGIFFTFLHCFCHTNYCIAFNECEFACK